MKNFDPKTTALILIDLQNNIISKKTEPESALYILKECKGLARKFREAKAPVIIVNVDFGDNLEKYPEGITAKEPIVESLNIGSSTIAEGLIKKGDYLITKHQWGAFTGTDLQEYLKNNGIETIVLAGISTNFGVESTARQAWEFNYNVVIVEDCCSSTINKEAHDFAFNCIFPRISRIVRAGNISFD